MGVAVASLSEALVPTAGDRGRRRSRLRIAQTARALPKPLQPYHLHQSLAVGCGSLRAGPATTPHQMGRPRLKGERLPNLSVVAEDPSTQWRSVVVAQWYGAEGRSVEVVSNTALWYSTGLPAVPLRWVLIRDPGEEFRTQALLCTDLGAEPERIISWFVRRWQMETTFQEVRQRLGFETQRGNGLRRLSSAPLQRCWAFSPWSRSSPTDKWPKKAHPPSAERPGTTNLVRRSRMRWRWYARSYGPALLFAGHSRSPTQ